jgi:UDP-N-acetylmuramyl pentapeptide synthase
LPDGLAIFLSGTANLKRMQPAIFVSAIRARHLIVIIFSLGRSFRFAQNNRGFVEKLSHSLPKNGFEAELCHPGNTGLETCAAHRLSNLCSVAVALLSLGADTDRFKSSAAWLHAFQQSQQVYRWANRVRHGMRIKSVERIHEH